MITSEIFLIKYEIEILLRWAQFLRKVIEEQTAIGPLEGEIAIKK